MKSILNQSVTVFSHFSEVHKNFFQFLERKSPTEYDLIMDRVYRETHIGGGQHRTFDGSHTFAGSYEKIKQSNGDVDFIEYIKSHINELVTPEGIPLFNFDHTQYHNLTNEISDSLGGVLSPGEIRQYATDLNSFNAGEVLSGGLGFFFQMAAIKSGDHKAISRTVALNISAGVFTANPIQLLTGLSGLAYGVYQGKIKSWDLLIGATPFLVSALAGKGVKLAGGTSGVALVASAIAAIGSAAIISHIESKNRKEVLDELRNNEKYIQIMTPVILQKYLEVGTMKRRTLKVAL